MAIVFFANEITVSLHFYELCRKATYSRFDRCHSCFDIIYSVFYFVDFRDYVFRDRTSSGGMLDCMGVDCCGPGCPWYIVGVWNTVGVCGCRVKGIVVEKFIPGEVLGFITADTKSTLLLNMLCSVCLRHAVHGLLGVTLPCVELEELVLGDPLAFLFAVFLFLFLWCFDSFPLPDICSLTLYPYTDKFPSHMSL